jgi:hypothetical protein
MLVDGWADRWERGLPVRECLRRATERLRGIGMTPLALEWYRRTAEAVLAEELAAERGAN